MSYVTGFFLVFAGMLIGYFLWYRDRSEEEQMRVSLERENENLRTSLKLAHHSQAVLDERFARQKGQLNVLQQLCDDWSASREQAERERAQLEVEVEDKRGRLEEVNADLQQERKLRIGLEDQLHAVNQQHLEKVQLVEQQWQTNFSQVETSLVQRQLELKASTEECERLKKSLHQSHAEVAELKSEIESKRQVLETATANASGLKQEYVSLESSLKSSNDLLKQARAECATAESEKRVAEESLAALDQQYKSLQQQLEKLNAELASNQNLKQEVGSLRTSLANGQQQLEKVARQRDEAIDRGKHSLAQMVGLQKRIDNQESTIHRLREKHKDALENLNRELQLRNDLETALEQQKLEWNARISEQQQQLDRRADELQSEFDRQKSRLESQLVDQTGQIDELTEQRESLAAQLESTTTALQDTQSQLVDFKERTQKLVTEAEELHATCRKMEALEAQLASESGQLKMSAQQIEELKSLLADRDVELATRSGELQSSRQRIAEFEQLMQAREEQLGQLTDELSVLRKQYSESQQRESEVQDQIEQLSQSQGQMEAVKAEYQHQIDAVKTKLRASEETIRMLRRERAGVLARLANYRTVSEPDATVISFRQAMEQKKRESAYDPEYGGHVRTDTVRGVVYTSEPESRDDLKLISGIAEVLEGRLNDYGIYTYRQIMEWKPEAVEEFSRLLAFRDRILRDDWKGQAQQLYEQKTKQSGAAA